MCVPLLLCCEWYKWASPLLSNGCCLQGDPVFKVAVTEAFFSPFLPSPFCIRDCIKYLDLYASTYVHIINSWLNACVVQMLLWWICKCRSIVVINVYWGIVYLGKPVIVNFMIRQIEGIIMLWHLFILQ